MLKLVELLFNKVFSLLHRKGSEYLTSKGSISLLIYKVIDIAAKLVILIFIVSNDQKL